MDQLLLKELQIIQQQQQQRQQQLNLLEQFKRLQSLSSPTIAPAPVSDQSNDVLEALVIRHLLGNEVQGSIASLFGNNTPPAPRPLSVEEILRVAASQRLLANLPSNNQAATAVTRLSPSSNSVPVSASPAEAHRDELLTRKRQAEVQERQIATLTEEHKPKRKRKSKTTVVRSVPAVASAAGNPKSAETKAVVKGHHGFPLPSLGCMQGSSVRKPQLTVCKTVWNGIKTKEMRKEIFLRKLYAGKLPLLSTKSSSVTMMKNGAKKQKRPSC